MSDRSKKVFLTTTVLTFISFTLSATFSLLAKEGKYPHGIIAKVNNRVIGKSIVLDEEKNISLSKIDSVSFLTGSTDINFRKIDGDKMTLKVAGKLTGFKVVKEDFIKITKEGSLISVKIDNSIFEKKSSLGFTSKNLTLDVGLPIRNELFVNISTGSGDINLKDISFKNLVRKAGSGDTYLEGVTLLSLDSSSGSGDVKVIQS
jgi:hypothetical protein